MRDRVIRICGVLAAVGLLGSPAPGGADEPMEGCYLRDYSAAHLARNPAQVVDRIALRVLQQEGGDMIARIWVDLADQGHVAASGHGGQRMTQFLICWDNEGTPFCAVECDGGSFEVRRQDAGGMVFETRYLMVGETDACGGAVDLAEQPGQAVSYRLDRVEDAICRGER